MLFDDNAVMEQIDVDGHYFIFTVQILGNP